MAEAFRIIVDQAGLADEIENEFVLIAFGEDLHRIADVLDEVAQIFVNLYKLFVGKDATMVEINPFAEDSNGSCE